MQLAAQRGLQGRQHDLVRWRAAGAGQRRRGGVQCGQHADAVGLLAQGGEVQPEALGDLEVSWTGSQEGTVDVGAEFDEGEAPPPSSEEEMPDE